MQTRQCLCPASLDSSPDYVYELQVRSVHDTLDTRSKNRIHIDTLSPVDEACFSPLKSARHHFSPPSSPPPLLSLQQRDLAQHGEQSILYFVDHVTSWTGAERKRTDLIGPIEGLLRYPLPSGERKVTTAPYWPHRREERVCIS